MDKLTIALIIAQNGLGTAAGLLTANRNKAQTKADKLPDGDPAKAKLLKSIKATDNLIAALNAANEGLNKYLQTKPE